MKLFLISQLSYVSSTICQNDAVNPTRPPTHTWSLALLRAREDWEKENCGLGNAALARCADKPQANVSRKTPIADFIVDEDPLKINEEGCSYLCEKKRGDEVLDEQPIKKETPVFSNGEECGAIGEEHGEMDHEKKVSICVEYQICKHD